ncbi:hypothetical protein MCB86_06600 [Pseudomonas sp. KSR10]|nr:hypothetical protein [Pseudomonas sp. KSR10]MCG6539744.1 hypothetical protein [Pseudomonas sp. KSR10]
MTFDEAVAAVTDQLELCLTGLTLDRKGECLILHARQAEPSVVLLCQT